MAYIANDGGVFKEVTPITTSAGEADANKIPQTNAQGVFDETLFPTGIGAETKMIKVGEALAAGNPVNVFDDEGTFKVRKADATTAGKDASGFVLSAYTVGQMAKVYFEGANNMVTGLSAGRVYLSTTAGQVSNTAPSESGNIVQDIGFATSPTSFTFQANPTLKLA